jgi:hypothetical protein
MHKKSQVQKIYRDFSQTFTMQHRKQFRTATSPNLYLTQIRGFSWHNNEIKMIRRGHYSSNDFQDSNKRKSTEKKTLGYLPRVLLFNAFELGAENCESSNYERSIRIHNRSLLNNEGNCVQMSF